MLPIPQLVVFILGVLFLQCPCVLADSHGSVWSVSDDDNTVYLAGSVHLLRKQDLPIPSEYYVAYKDSEYVIFELDMASVSLPEKRAEMLELGKLPSGVTLASVISKKTYGRLCRHVADKGLPRNVMDHLKPGMVLLTLSALEAQELGASPDNGVEALLFDLCKRDTKPSAGLETAEFQLSLFDQMTSDELDTLIERAIDDSSSTGESIEEIIKVWRSGDAEGLDELITENSPRGDSIHTLIMANRNRAWLPTIEKAIKGSRNEMFVVGAGHLVGEDGVVALLRAQGYKVSKFVD